MLTRTTRYTQLEVQAPQPVTPTVKPVSDSVAVLFQTSLAESQKDFKRPYAEAPSFARYALTQKGLPLELRDHVMHYVNNANMDSVFPKVDIAEELNHLMILQSEYQGQERLARQREDINTAQLSIMNLLR